MRPAGEAVLIATPAGVPNQTQARVASYPFPACSKSGVNYLIIAPVQS
jgi:hypothetical protein